MTSEASMYNQIKLNINDTLSLLAASLSPSLSPLPSKWRCSTVASNICPDLTIQPQPQSVVRAEEKRGGKPHRYVIHGIE